MSAEMRASHGSTRQQQHPADAVAVSRMIVDSASSSLAPPSTPKGSQAGTHPYHRPSDDLESYCMQSLIGSTSRHPLPSPHDRQGSPPLTQRVPVADATSTTASEDSSTKRSACSNDVLPERAVPPTTSPHHPDGMAATTATDLRRGGPNTTSASTTRGRRSLPHALAPQAPHEPAAAEGNVHDGSDHEPSPMVESPAVRAQRPPSSATEGFAPSMSDDGTSVGVDIDPPVRRYTEVGIPVPQEGSPSTPITAAKMWPAAGTTPRDAQPPSESMTQPRHAGGSTQCPTPAYHPTLHGVAPTRRRASSIDLDQVRDATAALDALVTLRSSLLSNQLLERHQHGPDKRSSDSFNLSTGGGTAPLGGVPPGRMGGAASSSVSEGASTINDLIASRYLNDATTPCEARLEKAVRLATELHGVAASLEGFTRYVLSHLQPRGTNSSASGVVPDGNGVAPSHTGPELPTFPTSAIPSAADLCKQTSLACRSTDSVFTAPLASGANAANTNQHNGPTDDLPFGQFTAFGGSNLLSGSFHPKGTASGGSNNGGMGQASTRLGIPPLQAFRKHSLGAPHTHATHATKGGHLGVETGFEQSPTVSSLMGTPVANRVAKTPTAALLLNFLSVTSSTIEPPYPLEDDAASLLAVENEVQIARSQRAQFREDGGFEMINDYMILDELGRGATGAVYLAIHQTTDEPYAIKSLAKVKQRRLLMQQRRASALDSAGGTGGIKDALRQTQGTDSASRVKRTAMTSPPEPSSLLQRNPIEQEIAIMKSLKHPNLVTLHEVIDDDEDQQIHLVMDYCRYGPLLKMHGPSAVPSRKGSFMSPKSARAQKPAGTSALTTSVVRPISKLALYAGQMCSGLRYLHKLNIVHRDIKPDNILVAEDDLVKITDFGESAITAILDDDGAELGGPHQHKATVGTPAFFAPELCAATRTGDTTPAAAVKLCSTTGKEADVWALGVTLYAALVGKLPFHGGTLDEQCRAIVNDKLTFPPLRELPENAGMSDLVYAYWKDALGSMLQKRPADRTSLKALSHHPCIVGPTDASKTILRRIDASMHHQDTPNATLRGRRSSTTLSLKDSFSGMEFHMVIDPAPHQTDGLSEQSLAGGGPIVPQTPSPPKHQRDEAALANARTHRHAVIAPPPHADASTDGVPPPVPSPKAPHDVIASKKHSMDETDDDEALEPLRQLVFGQSSSNSGGLSSRNAARIMFVSEQKRRAVISHATHLGVEPSMGFGSGEHGALVAQQLVSP